MVAKYVKKSRGIPAISVTSGMLIYQNVLITQTISESLVKIQQFRHINTKKTQ